jgi:hypothetical protein
VIDQPRYQKALEEAQADVYYYQTLAQEKRVEAAVTGWAYRRCLVKR